MAIDPFVSGNQSATKTPVTNGGGGSALAQLRALSANTPAPAPAPAAPKDGWSNIDDFMKSIGENPIVKGFSETPVIKQILDFMGTGMYTAGNATNDAMDTAQRIQNGQRAPHPDNFWDQVAAVQGLGNGAIVKGVLGGLGDPNYQKTQSSAIKKGMDIAHVDSDNPAAHVIQGVGGFAGDVLFDPLSYADGLGVIPAAVKGATRGAITYKAENALAKVGEKTGEDMAAGVAPSRWANAKQEANKDIAAYHDMRDQRDQLKAASKDLKGADDTARANYLVGNVTTLHPAVMKKLASDTDTGAIIERINKMTPEEKAAFEGSPAKATGIENAVDDIAAPHIGLSTFKPVTTEERLANELGKFKGTSKTPVYGNDVIKSVEDLRAARPDKIEKLTERPPVVEAMTDANRIPDTKAAIEALKEFNKGFEGKATIGVKDTINTATGKAKKTQYPVDSVIDILEHPKDDPELFQRNWEALDPESEGGFQRYKGPEPTKVPPLREVVPNPKRLTDEEYAKFGITPEHAELIRNGTPIKDIVDSNSTADIRKVISNIADGTIKPSALTGFYETLGTKDPKEIAKLLAEAIKQPAFKEAAGKLSDYGSVRKGLPNPELGVSGHAELGLPGKGFTADDLLSAKTPANPEQTRKFLESLYTQSAQELAAHPKATELRIMADNLFKGTIDEQARPAGPLRSLTGASVREDLNAAKYETKYNTHSGIWRMNRLINELRDLEKDAKETYWNSRSRMDKAFMTVMRDVDDRLRLAGFDQHLSNMQEVGDKLIVRYSPSDVLGALSQSDRIKYIFGNQRFKAKGSQISEMMPTAILDVAEVLTRSATKLNPDGTIDWLTLENKAMHTLQGKYSAVAGGKRVIENNLDAATSWKNNYEILREVDRLNEKKTKYLDSFIAAKGKPAEQQAIIDTAMKLSGEKFRIASQKRLTEMPKELIATFTKGMKEGKPSILSNLININMRNAALMGGTVAKPIGEASAKFSQEVLDALEHGTNGDHLSTLVAKPPFNTTDAAAKEILKENKQEVLNSVATPEEVRHAEKLNQNVKDPNYKPKSMGERVKAREAANKVNKDAFQRDPLMEAELAKPVGEMNPDVLFDLSFREINKDLLYRMYGTSRWFNKRTGMPITFDKITSSLHAGPALLTGYNNILRDMRRSGYTKEQLRVAFNELKDVGVHDQLTGELNAVLSTMFDSNKVNFLTRNSVGPEHFNKVLDSVKFDERFRVPEDATPHEMMNAWKQWDVTDVQDFFSKMMAAMVKTANDVSMGASFSKNFGKAVFEPGYVKIADKSGMNDFSQLIDKTLYYPKEVAQEMVHINRMMSESRSFKSGDKLHTFVNKIMDPIISNLKMTQTTLRPGHHVMSIIGDAWRNNLALTTIGYSNPAKQLKLYGEAYRIMAASLGDIEELSSFQNFMRTQSITGELKIQKDGNSGFEYYPNIQGGGRVSRQSLYDIAQARGVALPAHLGGMAEDYLTNFDDFTTFGEHATNKVVAGVQKVTEGLDRMANPIKPKLGMKNPYSLNKFTANRDTFTRLPMFLGAMRSRNFKSMEEAVDYAADFVRKWSPTAQDLGAAESKYVRRAIFYYTWTRGMIPRIIESAIMHPGVAITPYKGAYNLAIANGLDPNSLGDPFPPNLMLPDWYSQRVIGPQFKSGGWLSSNENDLWGMNPTGPLGDLLNQFGSNLKPGDFLKPETAFTKTVGTFVNMANPFIKAPAELGLGHTLQTNVPITDAGQYLQDMIGPARELSRLTGHEDFPVLHNGQITFEKRTESKFTKMTPDQQAHNLISEALNYGTGLGFTNYSDNSTKKSAEFQQKDAKTQAKKEALRFT